MRNLQFAIAIKLIEPFKEIKAMKSFNYTSEPRTATSFDLIRKHFDIDAKIPLCQMGTLLQNFHPF